MRNLLNLIVENFDMRLAFKRAVLFLCISIVSLPSFSETLTKEEEALAVITTLSQPTSRMTLFLYTLVLGNYAENLPQETEISAKLMGLTTPVSDRKAQIQNFLSEWSNRLETTDNPQSQMIFQELFSTKKFPFIEKLLNGALDNQALEALTNFKKLEMYADREKRELRIVQWTSYLVANPNYIDSGMAIAELFSLGGGPSAKSEAQNLKDRLRKAFEDHQKIDIVSPEMFLVGVGLLRTGFLGISYLSRYRVMNSVFSSIKNSQTISKAIAVSVGGHAAVLAWPQTQGPESYNKEINLPEFVKSKGLSTVTQGQLNERLSGLMKNWRAYRNTIADDMAEIFFIGEALTGRINVKIQNDPARIFKLKNRISRRFDSYMKSRKLEKVDRKAILALRQMMSPFLHGYKSKVDLFSPMAYGNPANCVGRALLYSSLFYPILMKYKSADFDFGLQYYTDHVEAVIVDNKKGNNFALQSMAAVPKAVDVPVYRPEVLLATYLYQLGIWKSGAEEFKFKSGIETKTSYYGTGLNPFVSRYVPVSIAHSLQPNLDQEDEYPISEDTKNQFLDPSAAENRRSEGNRGYQFPPAFGLRVSPNEYVQFNDQMTFWMARTPDYTSYYIHKDFEKLAGNPVELATAVVNSLQNKISSSEKFFSLKPTSVCALPKQEFESYVKSYEDFFLSYNILFKIWDFSKKQLIESENETEDSLHWPFFSDIYESLKEKNMRTRAHRLNEQSKQFFDQIFQDDLKLKTWIESLNNLDNTCRHRMGILFNVHASRLMYDWQRWRSEFDFSRETIVRARERIKRLELEIGKKEEQTKDKEPPPAINFKNLQGLRVKINTVAQPPKIKVSVHPHVFILLDFLGFFSLESPSRSLKLWSAFDVFEYVKSFYFINDSAFSGSHFSVGYGLEKLFNSVSNIFMDKLRLPPQYGYAVQDQYTEELADFLKKATAEDRDNLKKLLLKYISVSSGPHDSRYKSFQKALDMKFELPPGEHGPGDPPPPSMFDEIQKLDKTNFKKTK